MKFSSFSIWSVRWHLESVVQFLPWILLGYKMYTFQSKEDSRFARTGNCIQGIYWRNGCMTTVLSNRCWAREWWIREGVIGVTILAQCYSRGIVLCIAILYIVIFVLHASTSLHYLFNPKTESKRWCENNIISLCVVFQRGIRIS